MLRVVITHVGCPSDGVKRVDLGPSAEAACSRRPRPFPGWGRPFSTCRPLQLLADMWARMCRVAPYKVPPRAPAGGSVLVATVVSYTFC
jgi:hypothetical protein